MRDSKQYNSENVKNIFEYYKELIELFKPKFGASHGLQVLHKGNIDDENSIFFVGRESRGHGHCIDNLKPISQFESNFEWLDKKYRYTKSPFWRVVGKSQSIISEGSYDINIFNKIYWTNIYKVSPSKRKPNTKSIRKKQFEVCSNLLIAEIQYLKPKGVVFLTDAWIDKFLKKWADEKFITEISKNKDYNYFNKEFNFIINHNVLIPAIVLPHPQNKKSGASESDLVEHIKNRFF